MCGLCFICDNMTFKFVIRAAYGRDKQCIQALSAPSLAVTKRTIHSSPLPPSSSECCHPSRITLLEALGHALQPDLKAIYETNPEKSVAVTFLNTSLNDFLPPLDALAGTDK